MNQSNFSQQKLWIVLFLTAVLIILVACGGAEAPADTASQEAETAEEIIEEEAADMEESLGDDGFNPEATGSEEGDGSPFAPGKAVKVAPTRVASAGWVDMRTVTEDEAMMEIIEENQTEVVLIHQLNDEAGRSTMIFTPDQMHYTPPGSSANSNSAVTLETSETIRARLETLESTEPLVELSVTLACDQCDRGGNEETLVILWETTGLTLTMDEDEVVPEIGVLLSMIRIQHNARRRSLS